MYKNKMFLAISAILFSLASCVLPVAPVTEMVTVTFGVASETPLQASVAGARGAASTNASTVLISLESPVGTPVAGYTDRVLRLYNINGSLISEEIALAAGTYSLTKYILQDSNGNGIYATPTAGSPLAYLVQNPLPISFTTGGQSTVSVLPEVITTQGAVAGDFGYAGFDFTVVAVFDFLAQAKVPGPTGFVDTSASILVQSAAVTYYTGTLAPGVNQITLRDDAANYTVTISKPGVPVFSATYTNAQMKTFLSYPLLVTLDTDGIPPVAKIEFIGTDDLGGGGAGSFWVDAITSTGAMVAKISNDGVGYPSYAQTYTFILNDPIDAGEYFAFVWGGGMTSNTRTIKYYAADNTLLDTQVITFVNANQFRDPGFVSGDDYLEFYHDGSAILNTQRTSP